MEPNALAMMEILKSSRIGDMIGYITTFGITNFTESLLYNEYRDVNLDLYFNKLQDA